MEITILGSSNSIPTEKAENTHFIVSHAGRVVLVDCAGSPLVRIPQAGFPLDSIDDIILTHFHIDHVGGIPILLSGMRLLGRKKKLRVHGLEFTLNRLRSMMELVDISKWTDSYLPEYHDLRGHENEILIQEHQFMVSSTPVQHHLPNIGLRFDIAGKSLVYSSDTSPVETLVRLAKGCDLLIHEASGAADGHSTAAQAAQTAAKAGAKSLLLIHYPQQNGKQNDLVEEARPFFNGEIKLARDFMKISL